MKRKLISLNLALLLVAAVLPFGLLPAAAQTPDGYALFHKNDGSGVVQQEGLSAFYSTSNDRLLLYRRSPFTAEGKAVTSYNSQPDGRGTVYPLNRSVTDIYSRDESAPAQLYAQWEDAPGRHILYLYGDSNRPDAWQDAKGRVYILKSGYGDTATLLGGDAFSDPGGKERVVAWKTMRGTYGGDAEGVICYAAGDTIALKENLTLFPVFGSFSIQFHYEKKQAATGLPEAVETISVATHASQTLSAPRESQMYLENRVFLGWNSQPDGSGSWYPANGLGRNAPSHLYAQYQSLPKEGEYCVIQCAVQLESGRYREVIPLSDGVVRLPQRVLDGRAVGYYTAGKLVCLPGSDVRVSSGAFITAVVPEDGAQYGIIDGNGGLTADGSQYRAVSTWTTSGGLAEYRTFGAADTFTKAGHALTGYQGHATGLLYGPGDGVEQALRTEGNSQRIDFTAQYEPVTGSYIQYWGNGARTPSGAVQLVQDGLNLSEPGDAVYRENPFEAPEGMYFLGWKSVPGDSLSNVEWYDAGAPVSVTENTLLYAAWGQNRAVYHNTDAEGKQQERVVVNAAVQAHPVSSVTPSHVWMKELLVQKAKEKGLISGADETLADQSSVRIRSLLPLLVQLSQLSVDESAAKACSYSDCTNLTIREKAMVAVCVEWRILTPISSTWMGVNSSISRGELARALYQALALSGKIPSDTVGFAGFADVRVSHPCYVPISLLGGHGIVQGYRGSSDGSFYPDSTVDGHTMLLWLLAAREWQESGAVQSGYLAEPDHFLFSGWSTQPNSGGDWYLPGEMLPAGANVHLYENWVTLPTSGWYYVLRGPGLDNGKLVEIVPMQAQQERVTLPEGGTPLWKSGRYQGKKLPYGLGYGGFVDETVGLYPVGTPVVIHSGEQLQSWEPTALLSYHENIGAKSEVRLYYEYASYPSPTIHRVEEVFESLPEHHTFLGWNSAADGSGTPYSPQGAAGSGSSYPPQGVHTLYAQWEVEVWGDVNADNRLTVADAVLVKRMIDHPEAFSERQRRVADFDRDGQVTERDAIAIAMALAGPDDG